MASMFNMYFFFDSYLLADFVSKIANLAEEDHHPEITLEWEKLLFRGGPKIKGLHKAILLLLQRRIVFC